MSVSNTSNKAGPYSCDGAQTQFTFSFKIFKEEDLKVIHTDSSGKETTLTLTTDYTVAATNNDFDNGGTVTTVQTYPSGDKITIIRELAIKQETDYLENDPFPSETLEDALDRLTMTAQQLLEQINRVLIVPISDPSANLEIPTKTSRASKFLGFDSNGNAIASNISSAVPATAYMETLLDDENAQKAQETLQLVEAGQQVSAFIKTLLNDIDAGTAQSTLGISNFIKTLLDDADQQKAQETLGLVEAGQQVSNFIKKLLNDPDKETAKATLGAYGVIFESYQDQIDHYQGSWNDAQTDRDPANSAIINEDMSAWGAPADAVGALVNAEIGLLINADKKDESTEAYCELRYSQTYNSTPDSDAIIGGIKLYSPHTLGDNVKMEQLIKTAAMPVPFSYNGGTPYLTYQIFAGFTNMTSNSLSYSWSVELNLHGWIAGKQL